MGSDGDRNVEGHKERPPDGMTDGAESDAVSGDDASAERRLFGDRRDTFEAIIASELGVGRASLAADRVGEVGIERRCRATCVTASENRIVAGTETGVIIDEGDGFEQLGQSFEVAAVGSRDPGTRNLVAATADDQVCVWSSSGGWDEIGTVDSPGRFCGSFLAADDGVYRVSESLEFLGLDSAHDVAVAGERDGAIEPSEVTARCIFTATDDGLFRYSGESTDATWEREHDRASMVVVAAGDRVHAVDDEGVLERDDGHWERIATPVRPVDLDYGDRLVGITGDGTLLLEAGDKEQTVGSNEQADSSNEQEDGLKQWRTHSLGLRGVAELAVR